MSTTYTIYDERIERAPTLMHDAARPFVVIAIREGSSYRRGIRNECEGRYTTRKSAQARVRFLETRSL